MTKAVLKVIDGDADGLPHPTMAEQLAFWKPVLEARLERFCPSFVTASRGGSGCLVGGCMVSHYGR